MHHTDCTTVAEIAHAAYRLIIFVVCETLLPNPPSEILLMER